MEKMSSQFDKEGRYFAQLTEDGKLKIWNTISSSFEQEYVPDLHLTSPCTCLQFLEPFHITKNGSPRKKKKKHSLNNTPPDLLLGTSSGRLILYSISKGDVVCMIKGDLHSSITCLSSNDEDILYSGAEENVILWNLQQKTITSKWRAGNERISAILHILNMNRLLTAAKTIKLWNTNDKTLLRTFKGHSSEISLLKIVEFGSKYVISCSQGDRLMNCWNIAEDVSDEHPTASLLLEDSARNISLNTSPDGSTKLAASTTSGVVHIFHLMLNGKSLKPVKPKSTLQVVSDTGQKKDVITPIPIISCFIKNESNIMIVHGNSMVLTFEDVELTNKKIICLLRKLQNSKKNEINISKNVIPITENAHYVTPFNNSNSLATVKRKSDGKLEFPMEKRLENLTLSKTDEGVPRSSNMANLLLQGLRSKDPSIIRTVLFRKDEKIIKNTVKRLPLKVIAELIKELSKFIQGKTIWSQTGALWMKYLIQTHAALLISNPDLPDLLSPVLNSIENRLSLQTPLNRLKGRLDLLIYQVSANSSDSRENDEDAMLIFNDKDFEDSDNEEIDMENLINSESENEWSEENDSENDGKMDEDKSDSNDEEMSE